MMTDQKLKSIAEGYKDYILNRFSQSSKLGFLEVQISKNKNGYGLVVCFGAGWCNTPWHNELMDFVHKLDERVKAKYPEFTGFSRCGYASMNAVAAAGGMISERKLFQQMSYPEIY